jgi:hypothetical protein
MIINTKFITVQQAGRACLKRQLEIDEVNLPDYPRPLKKIKGTHKNYFQTQAAKYGFVMAVVRCNLP